MKNNQRVWLPRAGGRKPILATWAFPALLVTVFCGGCVGPERQRLVAKANMAFSESAVFADDFKLLPQMEPGVTYGAGQAAGCSSCR